MSLAKGSLRKVNKKGDNILGRFRIGLRLLDDLGSVRDLLDLAVLAEEVGFDSVWFPHDVLRQNSFPLISATAERTHRISLGLVGPNPYTLDPSEIATFIATLDELSGGRVMPSIGMHATEMFRWLGIPAGDPIQRTREAFQLVQMLLSGESAALDGEVYRWPREARLHMRLPLRTIPLYIAPFGKEFMAMSGALAAGSVPMITPPESAGDVVAAISAGAHGAGRSVEDLDIVGFCWISVAEDGSLARDTLGRIIAYFGQYLDDFALEKVGLTPESFQPLQAKLFSRDFNAVREMVTPDMLRLGIAGTPDHCGDRIMEMAKAGVNHVCVGGPLGPEPRRAVQLMGETIVPRLHSL